jgi:hypothetical protein
MEAMARDWTDDRLDVLNEKVTHGFERIDERFIQVDSRFEAIDKRFEKVDVDIRELRGEMAEMRRTMSQEFIGLAVGMASGFVALATLIVVASI